MNSAEQSEPWEAMLAHHPLTAEVIIQRERDLQQEAVLSHFYECFIVLQLKLDLVVMSPVSKTNCNRWNRKGWVKYCWVISQARLCLLTKRRKGLCSFPQDQELPCSCCLHQRCFTFSTIAIDVFKNHLLHCSLFLGNTYCLPDCIRDLQIQHLLFLYFHLVPTLLRHSSLLGEGKIE